MMTDQRQMERALLEQALNYMDAVALQVIVGAMNSPCAPETTDAQHELCKKAYDIACCMYIYRKEFRKSFFRQRALAPEPMMEF